MEIQTSKDPSSSNQHKKKGSSINEKRNLDDLSDDFDGEIEPKIEKKQKIAVAYKEGNIGTKDESRIFNNQFPELEIDLRKELLDLKNYIIQLERDWIQKFQALTAAQEDQAKINEELELKRKMEIQIKFKSFANIDPFYSRLCRVIYMQLSSLFVNAFLISNKAGGRMPDNPSKFAKFLEISSVFTSFIPYAGPFITAGLNITKIIHQHIKECTEQREADNISNIVARYLNGLNFEDFDLLAAEIALEIIQQTGRELKEITDKIEEKKQQKKQRRERRLKLVRKLIVKIKFKLKPKRKMNQKQKQKQQQGKEMSKESSLWGKIKSKISKGERSVEIKVGFAVFEFLRKVLSNEDPSSFQGQSKERFRQFFINLILKNGGWSLILNQTFNLSASPS